MTGSDFEGRVPDLPEGVVFEAEALEGEGLDAEGARDAHLVEGGDGVEKPDGVLHLGVVVVVGEVRVERVVVERDLCVGVGGGLPGLLGGEHGGGVVGRRGLGIVLAFACRAGGSGVVQS